MNKTHFTEIILLKAVYQHIVAINRNHDVYSDVHFVFNFPRSGKWERPYTQSVYHVYFIVR